MATFIILISPLLLWVPAQAADDAPMISGMMADRGLSVSNECHTPSNLEDIFLRACRNVLSDSARCVPAWNAFAAAFGFRDPNAVTAEDYSGYFDVVPVVSAPNTSLFWSGVADVIEKISKYPNISSSANQESSRIINAMFANDNVTCWCGNETAIVDTVNPCPVSVTAAFWERVSAHFAESAAGTAFWVGDGNRPGGAYQNTSFFTKVEFPRLTPDRVKRLVVIDVYNCSGGIAAERCGEGTLLELQNQALTKYGNSGYECNKVCGNPTDKQQVAMIARSSLNIIRSEQMLRSGYNHLEATTHILTLLLLLHYVVY